MEFDFAQLWNPVHVCLLVGYWRKLKIKSTKKLEKLEIRKKEELKLKIWQIKIKIEKLTDWDKSCVLKNIQQHFSIFQVSEEIRN